MEVSLRPVTSQNFRDCIRLTVAEDQQSFVATNVVSIAQAYVNPTWTPLAVYAGDELVGFAMHGYDEQTGRDWIIRLMIDQRFQGRGYGRAAMHILIDRIRQRPGCSAIWISYEQTNRVAETLYASLGFVPTGEIDDGEIVARLDLEGRGGEQQ